MAAQKSKSVKVYTDDATIKRMANFMDNGIGVNFVVVDVKCGSTSGTVKIGHGAKPEFRSGWRNLMILRSHIKMGRDPVFFRRSERARISRIWAASFQRVMAGEPRAVFRRAGETIGAYAVRQIRRHIDRGESMHGKMRALEPEAPRQKGWQPKRVAFGSYSFSKKWHYGDVPVLKRTGQLYESFYYKVSLI